MTTAPGIAQALLSKGILPLSAPPAGFGVRYAGGLAVTYLDHVRLRRRDRIGGVIHECHLVA